MLKAYQYAFYNMMVHNNASELEAYTGSTLAWQNKVYQNNYKQSLLASLVKTFKKMSEVIHRDQLHQIFIAFINANPSENQNLAEYGYSLPDWMSAHYQQNNNFNVMDSDDEIPDYLVDIARLDVLLKQSYYSKNSVDFDGLAFSSMSENEQVNTNFIRLNSIRVLKSEWDLEASLSQGMAMIADELKVGERKVFDDALDGLPLKSIDNFYVIYRDQGLPKWRSIDQDVYRILLFLETARSLKSISALPELNSGTHLPILIQKSWVTTQ